MVTTTSPSLPISHIDVPDPHDFKASFVYNFFVKDEVINDLGDIPIETLQRSGQSLSAKFFEMLNEKQRVPRYVKFSFKPANVKAIVPLGETKRHGGIRAATNPVTARSQRKQKSHGLGASGISIRENLDKIITEEQFASFAFTGLDFQDTHIDGKLFYIASGSVSSRLNAVIANTVPVVDKFKINLNGFSFTDAAKFLNHETPDALDGILGTEIMAQPEARGVTFFDDIKGQILKNTFDDIKMVTVHAQINNKHIGRLFENIVNEGSSIYGDEIRALIPTAKGIESRAKAAAMPNTIGPFDYETNIPYVDIRPVDEAIPTGLSAQVVGYIIDKYEIDTRPGASLIARNPIILEHHNATTGVDFAVKYSSSYTYSIRSIVAVEFPAFNSDTNQISTITALVASRPTPRSTVTCIEKQPPKSPTDFKVSWDYTQHMPRLTWSFPSNPQRDIKYFQVFKRLSINEPFQLIAEYDFNNAKPRLSKNETPDYRLVNKSEQPVTMHIDNHFNLLSTAIYAICAVDAHGLSSRYSMQFEIMFDQFKNGLNTKLISMAGAPKAYPNLHLNHDLFIDTIRDSGHTHMKIIFDPEVLELRDQFGNNLELISTDQTGGSYTMQIINIDYQKQQNVDIIINDRRDTNKILLSSRRVK